MSGNVKIELARLRIVRNKEKNKDVPIGLGRDFDVYIDDKKIPEVRRIIINKTPDEPVTASIEFLVDLDNFGD